MDIIVALQSIIILISGPIKSQHPLIFFILKISLSLFLIGLINLGYTLNILNIIIWDAGTIEISVEKMLCSDNMQ
jgi:hypothetical protein